MNHDSESQKTDLPRRTFLKTAGIAVAAGLATSTVPTASAAETPAPGATNRNKGPLGARLTTDKQKRTAFHSPLGSESSSR